MILGKQGKGNDPLKCIKYIVLDSFPCFFFFEKKSTLCSLAQLVP